MSPAIDERVVQMEFDNSRFERNVSTSISTLDKLKAALKLNNATDSLSAIEKQASGGLNLSGIGSAVETISSKFTVLGMIGVQALQRITNKALDAGEHLLKSLSVDQMSAGWTKYAEKTSSVQTIMAATEKTWEQSAKDMNFTGTQMEFVNSQMEKLNWFTDETSYSFNDMVSNIGKFTANNIPLETAVTAMQGISNWAAISGQKAGEASRAMYNLAQAIGVGSVKLMDWKSIENANMATAQFKEQVLEVAAANGQLKKEVDKTGKAIYKTAKGTEVTVEGFSQSLSEGWFNKDTLLSVLDTYGSFTNKLYEFSEATDLTATDILGLIEAQKKGTLSTSELAKAAASAGMSTTEFKKHLDELSSAENDFGYKAFKAAQQATTFADAIDATKDAASTRWMNIFENIFGDYEKARQVWTGFANFLYDTLVAPLETIEDWSTGFKAPFDTFNRLLNNTAETSGKSVSQILALVEAQKKGTLTQEDLNKALAVGITAEQYITDEKGKRVKVENKLNDAANNELLTTEEFSEMLQELSSGPYEDYINALFEASDNTGLSTKKLYDLVEAQRSGKLSTEELAKAAKDAGLSVEEFQEVLDGLVTVGSITGLDRIIAGLKGIWDFLFSTKENESGIFGNILRGIQRVVPGLEITSETVRNALKRFQEFGESLKLDAVWGARLRFVGEAIGKVFNFVSNTLKNYWDATKNLRTSIGNLVTSVAGFIVKILTLGRDIDDTGLKGETFQKICDKIAEFINKISDAISKVKLDELKEKFSGLSGVLQTVGSAFKWIFDKITNIDFSGIGSAIGTAFEWIKGKFEQLKTFVSQFDWSKIFKGAAGTGVLSLIGVKLFKAVKNMSSPFEALNGIGEKIQGILSGIGGALKSFETSVKVEAFKSIATAILLLAAALLILGFVNYENAINGVVAIAAIMAGMIVLFNAVKGLDKLNMVAVAGSMLLAAAAMLVLAVALAVLAGAIALFTLVAKMDGIKNGLSIMAMTLGIVTAALLIMSQMSPKVLVAAAAMLVLAVSLIVLAGAVALFTKVAQMDGIRNGLSVMAISLGIVVLALLALSAVGPVVILAAASVLVLSAALLVLAAALWAFSKVAAMESFGTGLAALALTLLFVVAALVALSAVGPMVIVAAAALLIVAAACVVLAIAIAAAGLALPLLAVGLAALGAGIGAGVASIGAGVDSFLQSVSEGITAAGEAIGSLIESIGSGMGQAISSLGEGIGEAITAIIASIGEGIGQGLQAISDAISSFGESLSNAGAGIQSFGDGVRSLEGISWGSTALGIGELAIALKKLKPGELSTSLGSASEAVISACTEMTTAISSVTPHTTTLSQSFTTMCTSIVSSIRSAVPQATSAMQQLGQAIVSAITSKMSAAKSAITSGLNSCVSEMRGFTSQFNNVGVNLAQGLANGIQSKIGEVAESARRMVREAIDSAKEEAETASPSKVTTRIGGFFGQGFANGILSKTDTVSAASESMVKSSIKSLSNARSLISSILEEDFTPVITPVIDTSKIVSSLSSIPGVSIKANVVSSEINAAQEARNMNIEAAASGSTSGNVVNLYIDGIKYNTDDYIDSSINNFVETIVRRQKMYAGG